MRRVHIVHWRPAEAEPLLEACRAAGWEAFCEPDARGTSVLKSIRAHPPDVLVIDCSRLPSHGRAVADWLQKTKKLAHIPVVFANGEAGVPTSRVAAAIRRAKPLEARPTPYKTRTVAEKLGLKTGSGLNVFDAPRDYLSIVGDLPEEVEVTEEDASIQPVTVWFVEAPDALLEGLRKMARMAGRTKLWIVWPKGSKAGVTQYLVRESALGAGLVDYKICALHGNWSGMLFARKKT